MNQQDAVAALEMTEENARECIAAADALDRLSSNPDFRKVIVEGYFKDEAVRLVHLKGSPGAQDEKNQADILRSIDAIGSLRGYFGALQQQREWALSALEDAREERERLEDEEGGFDA